MTEYGQGLRQEVTTGTAKYYRNYYWIIIQYCYLLNTKPIISSPLDCAVSSSNMCTLRLLGFATLLG